MNCPTPFASVPVSIARNTKLTPQARCLYLILASYANAERLCWPSRKRLATELGLSIRTIARLLSELELHNLIHREQHAGKTTLYRLLDGEDISRTVEEARVTNDTPVTNDTGSGDTHVLQTPVRSDSHAMDDTMEGHEWQGDGDTGDSPPRDTDVPQNYTSEQHH